MNCYGGCVKFGLVIGHKCSYEFCLKHIDMLTITNMVALKNFEIVWLSSKFNVS
jgi:hypothetical protein